MQFGMLGIQGDQSTFAHQPAKMTDAQAITGLGAMHVM